MAKITALVAIEDKAPVMKIQFDRAIGAILLRNEKVEKKLSKKEYDTLRKIAETILLSDERVEDSSINPYPNEEEK